MGLPALDPNTRFMAPCLPCSWVSHLNPRTISKASFLKSDSSCSLLTLFIKHSLGRSKGLPRWLSGKDCLPMQKTQEMWVRSLGWEDPLEKSMTTHSRTLAWEIP